METKDIKKIVAEKYSAIAKQVKTQNETSCCGTSSCDNVDYTIFADDYSALKGHHKDADLGLGCGLPTQFAKIKEGVTVVDLGSGAGNDCFVARAETGDKGKVIGIDFSDEMINKARENAKKLGYENVEFIYGDIEQIPLQDETADIVVSNCVLNLVPNKEKAFSEIYRILKKDGHFSISDIVIEGELPTALQKGAEMYAGCIAGAISKDKYLSIIKNTGFNNIAVQKQKPIFLPDEILSMYLSESELQNYKQSKVGIFSITVYGKK